jgi:hypothetical protein
MEINCTVRDIYAQSHVSLMTPFALVDPGSTIFREAVARHYHQLDSAA